MAGTIPLSMTQQFDVYGQPLAGGQLYIIQVGTVSTPQNAYQDLNLTPALAMPYPMTLDAAGRVPQFFLADGSVKIRLQDRNGVVQLASDSVLVIGASLGGGGGSSVDATQLIKTGMMMFAHTISTSDYPGFVRLNGNTIGSATSSASERANLDTQALFLFLWPDTTLTVSAGRGASAAADWAANKNLALPDWRGYAIGALDTMGALAGASGRISSMGAAATTLGGVGGAQTYTIVTANLPPHTHGGTTNTMDSNTSHSHTVTGGTQGGISTFVNYQSGGGISGPQNTSAIGIGSTNIDHRHTFTSSTTPGASSSAVNILNPRKNITFFMKL